MPISLPAIRELLPVIAESRLCYPGSIPLYLRILKRQAKEECLESQYILGLHYKVGYGVKTNRHKEKYWHTEAANAGFEKAQQFLGGEMVDTLQSCFFDYELQPALKNSAILCGIGICYERGIGAFTRNKPDLQKAFPFFQTASKARFEGSHGHARYKVAEAYEHGLGVAQDMDQAVFMYKKATLRRHTGACLRLARILEGGYGHPPDLKEALGYLQLGSRTGDARCQHELGLCYLTGERDIEIDKEKAVSLLKLSAKAGWGYAAYDLGKCYFHGKGTLRNPRKARKLIEKAYEKCPDPDYIEEFWNTHKIWNY
jgi:TPR repeat protein